MRNTNLIWVNQYTFEKGTNFRIHKVYIDSYFNSKFVTVEALTGQNKGIVINCSLDNFKRKIDSKSIEYFKICLNDYILAGWDIQRILNAGLCPNRYKRDLKQYLKYFNLLN